MARNILVVEDDRNISDLIRMYLEKEGFEVRSAYDGGKAIEEYDKQAPDMVLLDIMLPVVDGWGVCAHIREKGKTPIIMLTAKSDVGDRITGLEMGADDYLVKPFRLEEVDRALDWCLEHMPEPLRSLSVYAEREPQEFPLASVLYIEVLGHQSHIHTLRQTVVVRKSLDDLERAVDSPDFFRCHRSFLVNLGHVERIESSDFLMSDGARIPISSANLSRARDTFLDWVYRKAWESK